MDIFLDNTKNIKNTAKTIDCENINNRITKEEKEKLIQALIRRVFENMQDSSLIEPNTYEENVTEEINKLEASDNVITYVIDRFEENYAVCENRETRGMVNIEVSKLPNDVKEGDVLTYKDNTFSVNAELQKEIEERIQEKVRNIFEED